jgi:hypothetical protein
LEPAASNDGSDRRIWVSIDWANAPRGENISGRIEIYDQNKTARYVVSVPVFNPLSPRASELKGFVESNGVISIEAEHFTYKLDRGFNQGNAGWEIIPGLGRRGDSVAIFPTTARSIEQNIRQNSPVMEYAFYSFSEGEFDMSCYLIPTQPLQPGNGLRYAAGIDNEAPQIVSVDAGVEVSSRKWSENVLNASTVGTSRIRLTRGAHVLKIYMVDAGVVLDNIVINTGGLQKSYLGPPETIVKKL